MALLSVYDPTCNYLRDPEGVSEPLVFRWRLASDLAGARQAAWHAYVTSLSDGERRWDSGRVECEVCEATYAGDALAPGETCVWFVTVEDDQGTREHSVPAAFVVGEPGDSPSSDLGLQRTGFLWTSDVSLNEALEQEAEEDFRYGADATRLLWDVGAMPVGEEQIKPPHGAPLAKRLWHEALGVSFCDGRARRVRMCPDGLGDMAFVRGSLLTPQGLLLADLERADEGLRYVVSLPPGTTGILEWDGAMYELASGRHEFVTRDGRTATMGVTTTEGK